MSNSLSWGTLPCSVQEGSGKAGNRYEHREGDLVFEKGVFEKTIEIPIVESPLWSATLEFKVVLEDPVGCDSVEVSFDDLGSCAH